MARVFRGLVETGGAGARNRDGADGQALTQRATSCLVWIGNFNSHYFQYLDARMKY